MLREYIQVALQHAHYELIDQPGTPYYGEIAGLQGVLAVGESLEDCRANLEDVLDAWLVLGLRLGHEIPGLNHAR